MTKFYANTYSVLTYPGRFIWTKTSNSVK